MKRLFATLLVLLLALAPVAQAQSDLVPLRATAEAAGATVTWHQETQSATVEFNGVTFTVTIGEDGATLTANRIHIPQAVLERLLGATVPSEPAAPTEPNKDPTAAFVEALIQGEVTSDNFTEALKAAFRPEYFAVLKAQFAPLGEFKGARQVGNATHDGVHRLVTVEAQFDIPVTFTVRYNEWGQIDDFVGLPTEPALAPGSPAYADQNRFTEEPVVIGEGTFALPGTLTLPKGEGPFSAVVLVHGSGPNDRDETIGGVKVFRDLAHGLATEGIAVLRYEKVTRQHPNKVAAQQPYTLATETINDALAAVKLLQAHSQIDKVYVIGHSQGGLALPSILERDKSIAGGIAMAAPADALATLIEQNELMIANGELAPEQLDFVKGQIALLSDPNFDPDNPPAEFVLGFPHFFYDWVPKVTDLAKTQTQPLLILQGARDFQVPVSQFELWQTDLKDRDNVTYQLFEKLNHAFTEGEGEMSSMAEYYVPAHVPAYVIEAIADWLHNN